MGEADKQRIKELEARIRELEARPAREASAEVGTALRSIAGLEQKVIFSLGATLYHMVTGRPPFKTATAAERKTEEVIWPQDLNPKLSGSVCLVIAKMMAKRPAARYQTPKELLDALESLARSR